MLHELKVYKYIALCGRGWNIMDLSWEKYVLVVKDQTKMQLIDTSFFT